MRSHTGFLLILLVLAALVLAVLLARLTERPVDAPEPAVEAPVTEPAQDEPVSDITLFDPGDDWASLVDLEEFPVQAPDGLYRDLDETFMNIPRAGQVETDDDIRLDTGLPELPAPVPDLEEETEEEDP